mgnify:CR=1 FL=1
MLWDSLYGHHLSYSFSQTQGVVKGKRIEFNQFKNVKTKTPKQGQFIIEGEYGNFDLEEWIKVYDEYNKIQSSSTATLNAEPLQLTIKNIYFNKLF